VLQEAKVSMETKQSDGSRRLVSSVHDDFMTGPTCMMRYDSAGGSGRDVRLAAGAGEVPSIKLLYMSECRVSFMLG
jgi:hypothetical protein